MSGSGDRRDRGEHPCRGGRHRDARPAGKVGRGRGGGKVAEMKEMRKVRDTGQRGAGQRMTGRNGEVMGAETGR